MPELLKYLPHRPPMVLLDEVISINEEKAVCRVKISEKSLFFEQGHVPAWVGLEYIAQTIAAYAGKLSHDKGDAASIGFLLGARRYASEVSRFEDGQVLEIEVFPNYSDGSMGHFKGVIRSGEEVIAEATLTTYQPTPEMLEEMKQRLRNS